MGFSSSFADSQADSEGLGGLCLNGEVARHAGETKREGRHERATLGPWGIQMVNEVRPASLVA